MAVTGSSRMSLGTPAPRFALRDVVSGETVTLEEQRACPVLVLMFICNHCPFVKHIKEGLAEFGRVYLAQDVAIIAVSSNNADSHPQDGPEAMGEDAIRWGYDFPYLYDNTQQVAKAYGVACTPEFLVFDGNQTLVYRGQFDDSRPSSATPVTGRDLRAAVDAALAGRPVSADQKPSIGCNIKWRVGNAPDYA